MSLTLFDCSSLRKSEGIIIKGDYKITKLEKLKSPKCNLVCKVYDKRNNQPIPHATVQISELDLIGLTNDDGIFEFDLFAGKYKVTVSNIGNSSIETCTIKLASKTEITFELGTTIIH